MYRTRLLAVLAVSVGLAACNDGTSQALLRLEAEPAGPHCPTGGVAVQTGADRNGNQVLDDDEVAAEQTKYVCHGTAGTAGPSGASGDAGVNALSSVTAEPAGAHCTYGGVRIDAGLDLDGDGALGEAEVTSTRYVCDRASVDAIWFGNLTIRSQEDLDLLANIQVVTGDLLIEASPVAGLTLPSLRVVGGVLSLNARDGGLRDALAAPVDLTQVSLPALERAGTLEAHGLPALTTLSAPKLARLGTLSVSGNPTLTALALPALREVQYLYGSSNAALTSVSLPELRRAYSFSVTYNDLLTALSAPRLADVEQLFDVEANPKLSHCAVAGLLARLTRLPWSHYALGNDTLPTCTAAEVCAARVVPGVGGALHACLLPAPFADARTRCQALGTGADLVWFEAEAELTAFRAAVVARELPSDAWVGYSDVPMEGAWFATSGFAGWNPTTAPLTTPFWASGEPSGGTAEGSAFVYSDGTAGDDLATASKYALCRKP